MIQRVYDNLAKASIEVAKEEPLQFDIYVVTDDDRIEEHVLGFGGKVLRVDDDVPSGTERIGLGFDRYFRTEEISLIINVQGDEPLFPASELIRLAKYHLKSDVDVATIVRKRSDAEGFNDPNAVKVIFSEDSGRCFYFSRGPVPFDRENAGVPGHWFHHIGVYSYTPEALMKFCQVPVAYYETVEKLEQLRGLETGLSYGAITTTHRLIGVDGPADVAKVEGVLSDQRK
jgi:3-deoxy-manno-octulosonate cytidylyltransferase (CMP-KDO synthetase)